MRHLVMKNHLLSLLSFSFAVDDMDEIFLRFLDSISLFLFWNKTSTLAYITKIQFSGGVKEVTSETI